MTMKLEQSSFLGGRHRTEQGWADALLASADGQNALPRAHKRAAGRQRRPGCGRAACRKGSACRAGRRTVARRARPLLSLGLSGQRCESTDAARQHTTLVQDARLRWPDTFAQGPDGAIYMTARIRWSRTAALMTTWE